LRNDFAAMLADTTRSGRRDAQRDAGLAVGRWDGQNFFRLENERALQFVCSEHDQISVLRGVQ